MEIAYTRVQPFPVSEQPALSYSSVVMPCSVAPPFIRSAALARPRCTRRISFSCVGAMRHTLASYLSIHNGPTATLSDGHSTACADNVNVMRMRKQIAKEGRYFM